MEIRRGTRLPKPSRETNFSGANGGRDVLIFPVQLTMSRIGNLTRLILTLAIICATIHTYCSFMLALSAECGSTGYGCVQDILFICFLSTL